MGGAAKRGSKSSGWRGKAIARPPSATDQRVGSRRVCMCVGVWMGVGV